MSRPKAPHRFCRAASGRASAPAAPRARSAAGGPATSSSTGHRGGHERHQHGAVEAEREHAAGREGGAECEAGVAAEREQAHPLGLERSRGEVRVTGALGVEGGHADPGQHDRGERQRVAGREARQRDAEARHQHPRDHQPRQLEPVGGVPEQRLDQRGADGRGEHERSRGRVGVAALLHEEGQQRGHGRLAEVHAQVSAAQQAQAAAVELGAQRATTPRSAMLDDPLAGALGRPAVADAQVAVGVADEVEQHGRRLLGVGDVHRPVRGPVRQQPPDGLGEHPLRQRRPAGLVEHGVALGMAERVHQLEVAVRDLAQRRQRELEPLQRRCRARSAPATAPRGSRARAARRARPAGASRETPLRCSVMRDTPASSASRWSVRPPSRAARSRAGRRRAGARRAPAASRRPPLLHERNRSVT